MDYYGYMNGASWDIPWGIVKTVGASACALGPLFWATGTCVKLCRAASGWIEVAEAPDGRHSFTI